MTTLLFVRHGQSMANVEGIYAGHFDSPLSPLGEQQAKKTADFIVQNYAVDRIYSSDLRRAYATAEPVAAELSLPITPCRELREIFGGAWERQPFTALKTRYAADYSRWLSDIGNAVCTDGESVRDLAARVWQAVQQITDENDGKTVLITTHATPIRSLQCRLQGLPLCEMHTVPWVTNASVTVATAENGVFTLNAISLDAHLADSRTALPNTV